MAKLQFSIYIIIFVLTIGEKVISSNRNIHKNGPIRTRISDNRVGITKDNTEKFLLSWKQNISNFADDEKYVQSSTSRSRQNSPRNRVNIILEKHKKLFSQNSQDSFMTRENANLITNKHDNCGVAFSSEKQDYPDNNSNELKERDDNITKENYDSELRTNGNISYKNIHNRTQNDNYSSIFVTEPKINLSSESRGTNSNKWERKHIDIKLDEEAESVSLGNGSLLMSLSTVAVGLESKTISARIIGGEEAEKGAFPWLVALVDKEEVNMPFDMSQTRTLMIRNMIFT